MDTTTKVAIKPAEQIARAREPRRQTAKQAAFLFFLKNAGYSYDPAKETKQAGKARWARQLAKAERDARQLGYSFVWIGDDDCIGCNCGSPDCACYTGEPHETWICLMHNESGQVVQSLGSVCEPTREYRRVVEAELAAEELSDARAGAEVSR
jgi:hypothetical protein